MAKIHKTHIDAVPLVVHCADMEHIKHIWPRMSDLASDLGLPYQTVAAWKRRNRIPAENDGAIIDAAARRNAVLTYEQLAKARPGRVTNRR